MGTKRMVIVNTANHPWAVIDSALLGDTWPDVSIQELYFSPTREPLWWDPAASAPQVMPDEDMLLSKLVALDPDSVYLRVSPHTRSEYLVETVRAALSDTRLIVEFYDTSMQFSPEELLALNSNSSEQVGAALKGCDVAVNEADALVVKMGGDAFEDWKRIIKTPIISFFPSITNLPCREPKVPGATRHAVYAGSVLPVSFGEGDISVGHQPTSYLDRMVESVSCDLTVINATHSDETHNQYVQTQQRFERPHKRSYYSPRKYRGDLVREFLHRYDVGLCVGHGHRSYVTDAAKARLPNRMLSYIEAGLPMVVEDAFEYAAKLVEDYGAGTVIRTGEFETLPKIIMALPLIKCQRAVVELKAMMVSRNTTALYDLKRRLFGIDIQSPNRH